MRVSPQSRELSASVTLNHRAFIQPLFVEEGLQAPRLLENMHGICADTRTSVLRQVERDMERGIHKFLVFPVPVKREAYPRDFSFTTGLLRELRRVFGSDIWMAADCCLCAYTHNGHCGITDASGLKIDNAASVGLLSAYALELAAAGADTIVPSDMMDGRIASIRQRLNENGMDHVSIMSYSSKFSSQWYGPFRDACHSSPAAGLLGDRRSYQLSPANPEDAVLCALRDEEEGADMLMVKPAGWYMDMLWRIKEQVNVPVAAYHVSGEYAALEYMAGLGLLKREAAHLELWTSLKRAGADIIISYAARDAKSWIDHQTY
jgi:porphobilinogen synthase